MTFLEVKAIGVGITKLAMRLNILKEYSLKES